jgi:hypothetical protein
MSIRVDRLGGSTDATQEQGALGLSGSRLLFAGARESQAWLRTMTVGSQHSFASRRHGIALWVARAKNRKDKPFQ